MAQKGFKTQAEELTLPRTEHVKHAATDAVPYARPAQFASNDRKFAVLTPSAFSTNDPILAAIEKAEMLGSVDIRGGRAVTLERNNGERLNVIYASKAEQDECERIKNGCDYTDAEIKRFTALAYIKLSEPAPFVNLMAVSTPPGYRAGPPIIGINGKKFTPMYNELGEHVYNDTGVMCALPKAGLGSSLPTRNEDLIDEGQKLTIGYKLDDKGNLVQRTEAEAAVQRAFVEIDNRATKLPYQMDMISRITDEVVNESMQARFGPSAVSFKSAAPAEIKTDVTPTKPFSDAVAAVAGDEAPKSIVLKSGAPAPWAKPPEKQLTSLLSLDLSM